MLTIVCCGGGIDVVSLPRTLKLYTMKYYYEIHVTGKNGFSTSIITDMSMDEEDIILKAYEDDILHGDDCHHVDYVQELTYEEWNEWFNFK